MRRRLRVVSAAATVLAPLLVSSTAVPAEAAGPSLTVTTIGRDGTAIAGTPLRVFDATTGKPYGPSQVSGSAFPVAAGKYVVVTGISEGSANTYTLGAAIVTVPATTTATIDARRGTPLQVSLDAPDAGERELEAGICVGSAPGIRSGTYVGGPPGAHLYAIPNSSSLLRFAYQAEWPGAQGVYEATGATTGVPANPGGSFHAAYMATAHVASKRGPNAGNEDMVSFVPQGSPCQSGLGLSSSDAYGPQTLTGHLTAGKWDIRSDEIAEDGSIGDYHSVRDLAVGKSYSQTFYRAAWGPAHSLPYVRYGRISFNTAAMFQDPYTAGFENRLKVTWTLSRAGTVLTKETREVWTHTPHEVEKLLPGRGWYTLDAYAVRYHPGISYPPGLLSPSARATFHFYADPAVSQVAPVFLTRFLPAGLDELNHAKPHSTTPVGLFLDRSDPRNGVPFHADSPKTVQAWYSTDSGKTWHGLSVTHTSSGWSTAVPNPASGMISLSAKVTDAAGNSAQTTVNHAYPVS